ncbi:MAG: hypothetical protein N2513_04675 [Deltaproteobacteria bacterium]|nr:hypothetical protein [Deltaproteobacteria bacterium]
MTKIRIVCPISGSVCIECPIYRGRHYYLCISGEYRVDSQDDLQFSIPEELFTCKKVIRNVEELIERSEL